MFNFFGKGLLQGLSVTGRVIFRKKLTEEYPKVQVKMPEKWRGGFAFIPEKCIACGLCAMECPNDAILLLREKDENNKNKVTGYKINTAHCLSCGFCVEACPTKCLLFTTEFETASYSRKSRMLDLLKNPNTSAEFSTYAMPQPKPKPVTPAEEEESQT